MSVQLFAVDEVRIVLKRLLGRPRSSLKGFELRRFSVPNTWIIGAGVVVVAVILAIVTSDRPSPHSPNEAPSVASGSPPASRDNAALAPTTDPSASATIPSEATEVATRDSTGDVQTEIDALLAGESGVYGVVLMDQFGEITYSRNAETPFIAASLYKLVLLADIYRRVTEGELALDDEIELLPEYFSDPTVQDGYFERDAIGSTITLDEALLATGAYSSNVSARALLALTDETALSTLAASLGLTHSAFSVDLADLTEWPPTPGSDTSSSDLATAVAFVEIEATDGPMMLTTPGDMALYFQKLLRGEIVNPEVSSAIFGILSQQVVNDRFPVLLPSGTGTIHKTGNLDHVVHDVGVIYAPAGPIILAAMCESTRDDDHATEIIQQLALIAYHAAA